MKLLIFTIYDEKAQVFGTPFFTPAIGIASRMFSDLANNHDTTVGKHPEDYTLYHIGYYVDTGAQFENTTTPIFIGKATDYIEPKQQPGRIRGIENA